MPDAVTTVDAYLDTLAPDRRLAVAGICDVIRAHVDPAFEEGIQYGMIGWYLPHSVYPPGYHADPSQPLPFASVASQKHHIGLYLFCVYVDEDTKSWFTEAWRASGRRLDMGKSCVRVRSPDGVPLDVLAALFQRVRADEFVRRYEAARGARPERARRKKATRGAATRGKATPGKRPPGRASRPKS